MGNIVLLDDLTINQIAAGEVIERPASVVKELVENSIDAGAKNITIDIKNGGISYIRITDDGKGFLPDDMEIAFERHATSKIRKAEDLDHVKSMGFRGEALASIASIANVELVSRTHDSDIGYKIVIKAGEILEKEEVGCPVGTSITVTDLFFNTPVRYKFLKKDFTESGYIEDVVTRIGLVNTNIALKLINSGKVIIQTSGNGDMKTVVYNIYGKDIAENVMEVEYDYEDIKVTGVVGKPVIARSNRSNQQFFVNKRYIKDKILTGATEKAFKGMLTIGKYAFVILNLEMDPSKVDVNVHPAKLEVRFEEENKVFKAIYHTIKDVLLKNDLIPDSEEERNTSIKKGVFGQYNTETTQREESKKIYTPVETRVQQLTEAKIDMIDKPKIGGLFGKNTEKEETSIIEQIYNDRNNIKSNSNLSNTNLQMREENELYENKNIIEEKESQSASNIEDNEPYETKENIVPEKIKTDKNSFEEMYMKIFGKNVVNKEEEAKEEKNENILQEATITTGSNVSMFEKSEYSKPVCKFIGIAFKTYILIEMDGELYIIDQHAAHERIMYEKIKKNYYSDEIKDSQLMLLPDIITLTHKEMGIAKDNMKMFEKAGFVLEEFGENTIKLTGVPNVCIDLDTKELFLETLDEINTVARTAKQEVEEKFIATVACKAAVKANMALTKEEVDGLMEQILKLPNPFTCPHGRPTAIRMTKSDLEKKFARRQ